MILDAYTVHGKTDIAHLLIAACCPNCRLSILPSIVSEQLFNTREHSGQSCDC